MNKIKRVQGAWDVGFHNIVDRARKEYSRQLGKDISMREVTSIWADRNLTNFKYPKLRFKKKRR